MFCEVNCACNRILSRVIPLRIFDYKDDKHMLFTALVNTGVPI